MKSHQNQETVLGVPLQEYPLRCRTCPRLASLALRYPELDLSKQTFYPLAQAQADHVARLLFSAMGPGCQKENGSECGLTL